MSDEKKEVIVVDVRMPFWSIVALMIKFAIAAIPALIILIVIGSLLMGAIGSLFGSSFYWGHWRMM
jgi:hypothetical protein